MPVGSTNSPVIVLAITGHRKFENKAAIETSVHSILATLVNQKRNQGIADARLRLLCPLAEGTDRLVAKEVLSLPYGSLHAILPLTQRDYEADFLTPESIAEFNSLLAQADFVKVLSPQPNRPLAYQALGCHIVDECDILLAVWNGEAAEGLGGTGDVVEYARKRSKTLIIIDSNNPAQITYECLPDMGKDEAP